MIKTIALTLFFLLSFRAPLIARIYTSASGKTIEASFVGFNKKNVKLRLKSGKIIDYPIRKLSKQDIEYLKNHPFRSLPKIILDSSVHFPVYDKILQTCFINNKGKITTSHKIRQNELPTFSGGSYLTKKMGIYTMFLDKTGKKVLLDSESLGVCMFDATWDDDLIRTYDPNKKLFCFVDRKGKTVIPYIYKRASRMRDKRAWVNKEYSKNTTLINEQGKVIITLKNAYASSFSDGLCRVTTEINGKVEENYYNTSGKPAFPDKNLPKNKLGLFVEKHATIGNGIINNKGEWTLKPSSQNKAKRSGKLIADGITLIEHTVDEKSTVVNVIDIKTGKIVTTLPEGKVHKLLGNGLISITRESDSLSGLFDRLGNPVTDYKFKSISEFNQGYAKVKLPGDHKKSVINTKGEVIYTTPE